MDLIAICKLHSPVNKPASDMCALDRSTAADAYVLYALASSHAVVAETMKFSLFGVVLVLVDMAAIAASRFGLPKKVAVLSDDVGTTPPILMRRGVRKLPPNRTNEHDNRKGSDDRDFIPFICVSRTQNLLQ